MNVTSEMPALIRAPIIGGWPQSFFTWTAEVVANKEARAGALHVHLLAKWAVRDWRSGARAQRAARDMVAQALGFSSRHTLRKGMHVSGRLPKPKDRG
jgi:hypothetical protein